MSKLTTAEEAVNFWAPEGARIDRMLAELDNLLPQIVDGTSPITDDTREDVEEALTQARLAMDTILGAYARVLHHEKTLVQQYQPHGGAVQVVHRNGQGGYPPQGQPRWQQ